MNESNVIYTVFWASMPRFKELPDATSPSLLMAAGLPSSMVAILLKSILIPFECRLRSSLSWYLKKSQKELISRATDMLSTFDSLFRVQFHSDLSEVSLRD